EQVALYLIGHADTSIADGKHDIFAHHKTTISGTGLLVNGGIGGFNRESAAPRHGIASGGGPIHKYFLDLARVGFDVAEVRIIRSGKFDVFSNQAVEHFFHATNNVVELENMRVENLLPAKREELASKRGGASGSLVDLFQIFPDGAGSVLR